MGDAFATTLGAELSLKVQIVGVQDGAPVERTVGGGGVTAEFGGSVGLVGDPPGW